MRKRDRRQADMFPSGQDLPLFSGTPIPAPPGAFYRPAADAPRQASWTACPACLDTGSVAGYPCLCPASQEVKT